MLARPALGLLLAAGLAACAAQQQAAAPKPPPVTAAQYAAMQRLVGGSPRARAQLTAECAAGKFTATPDQQAMMAAILDVDVASVHRIFCERLVAAIGRGEISYEDYTALRAESHDPELWRRLLRALRVVPGEEQV